MNMGRVFNARFVLLVSSACLVFLLGVPAAKAGAIASCDEPIVFEGAEVNVVVLPYFQANRSPMALNALGGQLALLVKLETLYRALSYDHWGVILLTGPK